MKSKYRAHTENLRAVEKALSVVERDLKEYISNAEEDYTSVYTKLFSHLVNMWIEVRVLKLANEEDVFSKLEITQIECSRSIEERWKNALNLSFLKAYKLKSLSEIEKPQTPPTARARRKFILQIIETELIESIQIRNKIAHGQWLYGFSSNYENIDYEFTKHIRTDNILKIQYRRLIFKTLAQIIHDLAVSKPTFERDFDNNFTLMEKQKITFDNKRIDKYKQIMVEKKKRGKQHKDKNYQSITKK